MASELTPYEGKLEPGEEYDRFGFASASFDRRELPLPGLRVP